MENPIITTNPIQSIEIEGNSERDKEIENSRQMNLKKDKELKRKHIIKEIINIILILLAIFVVIAILYGICYAIYISINSIKLKVDKNTKEIVIDKSYESKRFLTISGYSQLERIIVKNDCVTTVEEVGIKNNPKLSSIITEDFAFYYTNSLTLNSID